MGTVEDMNLKTPKEAREALCVKRSCNKCEELSWCDDCEKKFCKCYQDWRMMPDTRSLCMECYTAEKYWNKKEEEKK